MSATHTDSVTHLKKAGLRATRQRIAILTALLKSQVPVDVRDIARTLGKANIDTVTIYRTLESFLSAKIIKRIDLRLGHSYFEIRDEHDHHHIVCTNCGTLEDFLGCDFPSLSALALKRSRSFTTVTGHSLELFGLCENCA